MALIDRRSGRAAKGDSLFSRLVDQQYEARHEQVERENAEHLRTLDDETLVSNGLDRKVLIAGKVH